MTKLVEFQMGDGEPLFVEVEDVESDAIQPVAKRPGEIAAKAKKTFGEALDSLKPMVRDIKQRVDALNEPADEVEVKFSIKLSGEMGAVLTKVGGEATYEITLKWHRS
jgi:hypothetical protein